MDTILVVDDSLTDITLIRNMLTGFEVISAADGIEALEQIEIHPEIDLVLLDLHMPRLNGFGVLQRLLLDKRQVPVIILTNVEEIDQEIRGLDLGAVDYIRKPLNMKALKKRIEVQLRLKKATELVRQHNRLLEETVEQRTAEIQRTNEITINALVRLLEVRNVESSDHSRRTKLMMGLMCNSLKQKNLNGYHLSARKINELIQTTPLHDIGKVGIPDSILLKPGKLNADEYAIMKEHVRKGVEALNYSAGSEASQISFIETAKELIENHHEWFDGSGYPNRKKGTAIPLGGRLMAVIDVYDALTSKRIYKEALTHEEALGIMQEECDRHFDPIIFSTFLELGDSFRAIAQAGAVS